jgi:hypothetical protein
MMGIKSLCILLNVWIFIKKKIIEEFLLNFIFMKFKLQVFSRILEA